MTNNTSLYNMGGWSQLFFFCFLFFFGFTTTILVTSLSLDISELWQSARTMRMALMIQTVCMFLIPPLMFAFLCQEKPKAYLKIKEDNRNILLLLLAIVLIAVIQPLINTISYYNHQIVLPETLAPFETWMKEKELSAEKTVHLLFGDRSVAGLIFNLMVIAIVAGLCEEIFFRGCLQQIMQKIVKNKHAAIWITAFIFSTIHFQFYGFIARFLLGALLGYLFVWANNIWIPVIVHTVHNGINVVLSYLLFDTPEYEQIENFTFEHNIWLILFSFVFTFICIFFIYRKRGIESII